VALDELYSFHGRLSKRESAACPQYLRDPGVDAVEVVGGLMVGKQQKAPS
jgi:hypothetical protein